MTVSNEVLAAAETVGRNTGIAPAALLAVALVESGAQAFAVIDGRREPLIRFEGHCFDRALAGRAREIARTAGLASPKAGAIANPASQAGRWRLLRRAAAIDAPAAYAATSWGLCQVMGLHWGRLGFDSAAALAASARASAEGQLTIAAKFLALGGLSDMLARGEFKAFARAYNGPAFARHHYDRKIAAAFEAAAAALAREADAPAEA